LYYFYVEQKKNILNLADSSIQNMSIYLTSTGNLTDVYDGAIQFVVGPDRKVNFIQNYIQNKVSSIKASLEPSIFSKI
jgi:hypothetical protein